MDVTRTFLYSLLLTISFSAFASAEVEYISPEKHAELENLFNSAEFRADKDPQTIEAHQWKCDMFGARSKMQVQRGLKLYDLKMSGSDWHNDGAQVISDYQAGELALIGHKDRFEDQVKITKDGQLVSRLSLNNAAKTVIAYSVCKTL